MQKTPLFAPKVSSRSLVLGLLALVILSPIGWSGTAQALVHFNVGYVTTGTAPRSPSLGDINGDGNLDLVVANNVNNNVSIFLGNGDWTFTPGTPATVATGTGPRGTAFGELNGDGKLDLVVLNGGSNNVSVFLGNGNGTFAPGTPATVATGTGPRNLILSDMNDDGKLDILITNCGDNTVSVLLGNGNGTFTAASPVSTSPGTCPHGLRLGDLNGDGKLDLVVANNGSGNVSVLIGNGNGTFTAASPATISSGTNPTGLRLADLNSDGKLDLVVTNTGANTVSVRLGNGDGTFQPKTDYTAGAGATSPYLADMDADGSLDLIVVNSGDSSGLTGASIFLGDGDGTFQPKTDYGTASGPTGVAVGDLNGDGMLDAVMSGTNNGTGTTVAIFKNLTAVLAVFPNGSGMGSVTSNTGGINCPTSCRAYFSTNSTPSVTLTATPSPGATFKGWSGAAGPANSCSGTGTCTVTMDQSRIIMAMFEQVSGEGGFTLNDLAGNWNLFYYADAVTGNEPSWATLSLQLNASGILISGTYLDSDNNSGTFPVGAGAFIMDKAGLVSGWVGDAGGSVAFPYGKLSPSKTILGALAMEGPSGRGMIVGTKVGGTFSSSDLAGTWYGSYFLDYSSGNDPGWSSPVFTIDATGAVTGGNYTLSNGSSGTINGGTFPIDSNGVITSASVTSPDGGGPTFTHGRLDSSKTLLAAVANEPPNGRALVLGFKGGRSFTTADLAGTWHFANYGDNSPTNGPHWSVATLTLNASGTLTSGTFVSSLGYFGTLSSGTFSIDSAGVITGSVAAAGGGGMSFPLAKMDASKTLIAAANSESPNGFGVTLGIKGGSTYLPTLSVTKAGTGTGTVQSTPLVINCGSICLGAFTLAESVSLVATPDPGSTFAGWSGDTFCTGTAPCILPMTEAKGVTATFDLIANHPLNVTVAGSGGGSVSSQPSGISACTDLCGASFQEGTVVTLTATADAGATFREWRSTAPGHPCDGSTSPTCQITMDGPKSARAVFSKTFTDPTLTPQTTSIRLVHVADLRDAIDRLRLRGGLGAFPWTDISLTPGSSPVKRQHLLDLRTALDAAYTVLGRTHTPYVETAITVGSTPIKASHLSELRTFVRGLE